MIQRPTQRLLFLNAAILLCALAAVPARAATVSVDAVPGGTLDATAVIAAGTGFSVDILISDVADLAGFQLTLGWDPAIVAATGLTSGDLFGLDGFELRNRQGAATWTFSEVSFAADGLAIGSPVLLASVRMSALAAGTSGLTLTDIFLTDGPGNLFGATAAGASIEVTAAPLPGTALLLAAGLLGLARRRA